MKTRRKLLRLGAALGLSGLLAAGHAQPPEGRGHGKDKGKDKDKGPHREDERQGADGGSQFSVSIRYEQARNLAVQGGYTGYKPLPPGIRKNLARGKPLPPGIVKKAAPPALLRQLPQRPGYEWQVCGTDLVLVAVGTLIVAEVLKSVFD